MNFVLTILILCVTENDNNMILIFFVCFLLGWYRGVSTKKPNVKVMNNFIIFSNVGSCLVCLFDIKTIFTVHLLIFYSSHTHFFLYKTVLVSASAILE